MGLNCNKGFLSPLLFLTFCIGIGLSVEISAGEKDPFCEITPSIKCLEPGQEVSLQVGETDIGINKDFIKICNNANKTNSSIDVVVVIDNTKSMDNLFVVDGISRYCSAQDIKNKEVSEDPECISGDPLQLRGPAVESFLDSALAKGGNDTYIGIVSFAQYAEDVLGNLVLLDSKSIGSIKNKIDMRTKGYTNYTSAFTKAMEILSHSRKPKSQQAIIFISDGVPNFPEYNPREYQVEWDKWPIVHSVFLGSNTKNYKDMEDISAKTGGKFFLVKDANKLASLLTKDILNEVFSNVTPFKTTIQNTKTGKEFNVGKANHQSVPDSSFYRVKMPGPIYLEPGVNPIIITTKLGDNGSQGQIQSKIIVTKGGNPVESGILTRVCKDKSTITLFNQKDKAISQTGEAYTIADEKVKFVVKSEFDVDSITVELKLENGDRELPKSTKDALLAGTWTGNSPFAHLVTKMSPLDGKMQTKGPERIVAIYRNPFIPPDSASTVVSVRYGPGVDNAAYFDKNGDGRIDYVSIQFDAKINAVPSQLEFLLNENGKREVRLATLAKGEISFGKYSDGTANQGLVLVNLSQPFSHGITSITKPDSLGRTFLQAEIPLMNQYFDISDSIPPVIIAARVIEANSDHPEKQIEIEFSENVVIPPTLNPALIVKRENHEFSTQEIVFTKMEKINDRKYIFSVAPSSPFQPVGSDSVSLVEESGTQDSKQNVITGKNFQPMLGLQPSQELHGLTVSQPKQRNIDRSAIESAINYDAPAVAIDKSGNPISGVVDGKCGTCYIKAGDEFIGPVISIGIEGPASYNMKIFTNLGEFVTNFSGNIRADDLGLLQSTTQGSKTIYTQQLVWTGKSKEKRFVGNGVYILVAKVDFPLNTKTGAKANSETKTLIFGHFR